MQLLLKKHIKNELYGRGKGNEIFYFRYVSKSAHDVPVDFGMLNYGLFSVQLRYLSISSLYINDSKSSKKKKSVKRVTLLKQILSQTTARQLSTIQLLAHRTAQR